VEKLREFPSETVKQLEALSLVARKIGTTLDLQETLDAVVSTVAELVPCSLAEISLWDQERGLLVLRSLHCSPDRIYPLGQAFPPGKGYTGWIVRHKKPLWVPDTSKRTDIRPDLLPGEKPFQSYIGFPLIAGDELIGTLVLIHERAEAFQHDDSVLVETLAGFAAAAIHKARLYEQLSHHHQELSALYSITETVNRPPKLKELMRQALDRVISVTGADGGAIRLLDPEGKNLFLATHQGLSEDYINRAGRFPISEEIVGWVARSAKPSLSKDMWTDERVSSKVLPLLKEVHHRALAQVPLMAQDKLVGTLGLVSRTPGFFSEEDLNLLNAIGQQLGIAIANAQLFEETTRRAQRLAALNAVASVFNKGIELDPLLSSALEKIIDVTGVDAALIHLIDSVTEKLQLAHVRGLSGKSLERLQKESCSGERVLRLGSIIKGKITLLVQEGSSLPLSKDDARIFLRDGVQSYIAVPLRSSKNSPGTLSVLSRKPRFFQQDDVDLIVSIGHQLGTAVENAGLRRQALEAERLVAVGRVAETVAHDLRGPLGGIINSAEYLARPHVSTDIRQKICGRMAASARRLISTVQGILDYARNGHMSTCFSSCALPAFIRETIDVFKEDFARRKIELDFNWEYDGEITMDSDRMAQVVSNITANARDAMTEGGRLTISTQKDDDWVEIRFADTGPGVPPELRDHIFEPFVSHGKKRGAGLGLSIAKRIVEEHGGRIRVEHAPSAGATFVIRLPCGA
jgi:GAF domain-containing protein